MAHAWTNPSVLQFAGSDDPVVVVQRAARDLVVRAIERGWQGPPFDPFQLAEILGHRVVPSQDVVDASLSPEGRKLRIDFDPNQSKRRIRFSIAHEIAHTLFPDCRERVRHRVSREAMRGDEWQLEMLCNMAAGEILLPAGSFEMDSSKRITAEELLDYQDKFDVSMEAVLLRTVRLERRSCAMFVASRQDSHFQLDYAVESFGADFGIYQGMKLPENTCVANCRALGYTAKGDETWSEGQALHVEAVAIPSYPGQYRPRVAGIVFRKGERTDFAPSIDFVIGDATCPHGSGEKIIAHVVNDAAAMWGGRGFALAVRKKWPHVQDAFRQWSITNNASFSLGSTHTVKADDRVSVFSMIAQHGYGQSRHPRIRYKYLEDCLAQLTEYARSLSASVHMPRIGCGEAGGNWALVEDLVRECVSDHGIPVTVYDLPSKRASSRRSKSTEQRSLFE